MVVDEIPGPAVFHLKLASFPGICTIYIRPALDIIALVGINLIPNLINLAEVNLTSAALLSP